MTWRAVSVVETEQNETPIALNTVQTCTFNLNADEFHGFLLNVITLFNSIKPGGKHMPHLI
jgi:hypothetical protein